MNTKTSLVKVGGQSLSAYTAEKLFPAIIRNSGDPAAKRFLEFFLVTIGNANTRDAYHRACVRFFVWCQHQRIEHLLSIEPIHVAIYIETLRSEFERPSIKQHLAALRTLFDWLVVGQVIPTNPAASVRGPKHVAKRGMTHALTTVEARLLLDSIPGVTLIELRDRALISLMLFSFARVGAVVAMEVADYYPQGKRWWVRLHEKGGKRHEMPAHHKLEYHLDSYLNAAGLSGLRDTPLFRSSPPGKRGLKDTGMTRIDIYRMVRRRAIAAGLSGNVSCHTFRATGITAYLGNGGTLENAQNMAAHESPRTTKLYDRTGDQITLDEIERIVI